MCCVLQFLRVAASYSTWLAEIVGVSEVADAGWAFAPVNAILVLRLALLVQRGVEVRCSGRFGQLASELSWDRKKAVELARVVPMELYQVVKVEVWSLETPILELACL